MRVLVSTDSSCLVSRTVFDKYDINVFPLNVIIDGEEFLDGVTINQDELKVAMRSNKVIKTSTPPLGDVIDYFENLLAKGYDHIIHFTISSKLSSMYELFKNVAEQHFSGKVTVIDSFSVSTDMLSQVFFAYDEVQKGTAIEDIVKLNKKRIRNAFFMFIPENLNALKNGGRISPAVALIGNSIGIKPVIELKNGALEKKEMIRNTKRALIDAVAKTLESYPDTDFDFTIISFDAEERTLKYVLDFAQENIKNSKLITGFLPINVCAHVGPGTIGLVVSPRINGKSLNDFI